MTEEIKPFRIDVPQADLDDLADRLARTRWPAQLPGEGWSRGVPVEYLKDLAEYWRTEFDWRAFEARLNAYPQFTTEINGYEVHFLHVRSADPDALPLILTHGWPNSIVEFVDVIERLGDFHLVIPTVPGYGFSAAPRETGWNVDRVARMWAELMRRLGYDRYGTQGGDLGAYIAPAVAAADPEHVVGVHIDGGIGFPTEDDFPELTEDERALAEMMKQWSSGAVDHHTLLRVAPQTFAFGWTDSPTALLAWLIQKFQEFTPTVDLPEKAIARDLILANATLYWLTASAGSSSWFMYENTKFEWPVGQAKVPTGVFHGPPAIRRLAERANTVIHWPEGNPGGHFVAMEVPDAHAEDIREFFAKVR